MAPSTSQRPGGIFCLVGPLAGSNRSLPKRNRSHGPPFLNFGY
jgi:hypothetical protein